MQGLRQLMACPDGYIITKLLVVVRSSARATSHCILQHLSVQTLKQNRLQHNFYDPNCDRRLDPKSYIDVVAQLHNCKYLAITTAKLWPKSTKQCFPCPISVRAHFNHGLKIRHFNAYFTYFSRDPHLILRNMSCQDPFLGAAILVDDARLYLACTVQANLICLAKTATSQVNSTDGSQPSVRAHLACLIQQKEFSRRCHSRSWR